MIEQHAIIEGLYKEGSMCDEAYASRAAGCPASESASVPNGQEPPFHVRDPFTLMHAF